MLLTTILAVLIQTSSANCSAFNSSVSVVWLAPTITQIGYTVGSLVVPGSFLNFQGFLTFDLTSTQIILTFTNGSNSFAAYSFNGFGFTITAGTFSYANAVVNSASTFRLKDPLITSSTNLFVNMSTLPWVAGQELIIDLCPVCSERKTCVGCTLNSNCVFCLDTHLCDSSPGTCQDYVADPKFCPPPCSSFRACELCLQQGMECEWCLSTSSIFGKNFLFYQEGQESRTKRKGGTTLFQAIDNWGFN